MTPIEVIKYAYRQSKDGFVLSFVVHPDDMVPEIANAKIGTRFAMALVEIDDTDQPVERPKPKAEKTQAQICGMLCNEPTFQVFIKETAMLDAKPDPEACAEAVRALCGVTSRKEFDILGSPAASSWMDLKGKYEAWKLVP